MEGQTLFVEILVIFLSWKLFLQIQAQNTFILFIGEVKETRKEIIYSVWPVLFIIIIASRPAPLLCQPGRILEQIIFRFCQVFVLPSLSHYDWPEYITDQSYTQSPRTKYLFWQTSIFLLLTESLASQSQASDFPCCWRLWGQKRINQIRDSLHSLYYQLKGKSWPSDGFCSELLTLWRSQQPVLDGKGYSFLFLVC